MAYKYQTPIGMRRPRKAPTGGGSKARAKAWYEIRCLLCGNVQRTELGRKTDTCTKCHVIIQGPWS